MDEHRFVGLVAAAENGAPRFIVPKLDQNYRKSDIDLLSQHSTDQPNFYVKLAATLRGSRPGVQSASFIMTSLMTS